MYLEPGPSISFLGRCIARPEDSIEMSMPASYIDKMLEQLDMLTCRHVAILQELMHFAS